MRWMLGHWDSRKWRAWRPAVAFRIVSTSESRSVRFGMPWTPARSNARRFESYKRMRRLFDDLVKARGPKYRPPC